MLRPRVERLFLPDAGPQHTQNYSNEFRHMLRSVEVLEVCTPKQVLEAYALALENKHSTLVVENG